MCLYCKIAINKTINLMKKHNKTLSLEDLTSHQQRIRSIVRKISEYSPTFHVNPGYNHSQIINKIKRQRENHQDKLFQQNMKIIQKLQNIQPKINTKFFPSVNLAIRSKRKCTSLSQQKFKQSRNKSNYHVKAQDQLLQQNIQMIQKLEIIDKKINCWQDKSLLNSKVIRQKKQKQKRNQMLQKFKQISMQMKSLRIKHDQSRITQKSPYLTDGNVRKQSQTSFETNSCSFLTSKPRK